MIEIKEIIWQQGFRLGAVADSLGMNRGSLSRKLHQKQGMWLTSGQIKQIGEFIDCDLSRYIERAEKEPTGENQK